MPDSPAASSYRLAPALGARLVGRSLVTLAVLVLLATGVGLLVGAGWLPAGVITAVGLVLVGGWAWWLLRVAWALRLTSEGYVVRLLGGIGATAAPWADVTELVASSPGGEPCLVLQLSDGRARRRPGLSGPHGRPGLIRSARRGPCSLCSLSGRRRLARFMAPAC